MKSHQSANTTKISLPTGALPQVLPSRKLSVGEAAAHLGISKAWLNKQRIYGSGPIFVKIGRRVLYDVHDLEAWVAGMKRKHTAEYQ